MGNVKVSDELTLIIANSGKGNLSISFTVCHLRIILSTYGEIFVFVQNSLVISRLIFRFESVIPLSQFQE